MIKEYRYDLLGKEIKVTIGKVAEQADGACLVQCGETIVLVTATASKQPRDGIDFFPLSCDFEEKLYSVGKIPGGFIKREGRASEKAVLTSRLIDRPLRPLFPEGYRNDVQIIATALSVEEDYTPDILAMIGSSIALTISDIPFQGPTGSVNVGLVDGKFVINPDTVEREKSTLDLIVAGTEDAVMMVEAGSEELDESTMLDAIMTAHDEIKGICKFIEEIREQAGKEKKEFVLEKVNEDIEEEITSYALSKMTAAIQTIDKQERQDKMDAVKEEVTTYFGEKYPEDEEIFKTIRTALDHILKNEVRRLIVEEGIRPDNRKPSEIRAITSEVGLLPRTHGSGLFTRGQTQVLTVATLGAASDVQIVDGLGEDESKRYMHHYNFPPYSVGEARFMRGPGRREIGHGALAERALIPVLPSLEDFPYTIRLVSEVLSSNGSSSQASVCGSSLSLLDAGVPIKSPVAGIAMGLMKEGDKVAILSDIQGMEDHLGDMDFKIAGTKDGITAIQMDIKIAGIEREILEEALASAKEGRLHILDRMNSEISEPKEDLSPYAPRIITMSVNPDKIRDIIGPGGKVINNIIDETGVKIDINDEGHVVIASENTELGEKAIAMIEDIIKDVEIGAIYDGKVIKIMPFGAFVEVMKGKEGLVHISNISKERVDKVEDVLSVGDIIPTKVTGVDKQGRINLSFKDALPEEEKEEEEKKDQDNK